MMISPIRRSSPFLNLRLPPAGLSVGLALCLTLHGTLAPAVPIEEDPNGFEDIPWGSVLSDKDRFIQVEDNGHSQTYERKDHPPMLGTTPVDSVRFTTFRDRFGRVTVRYSGKAAHDAIMTHLQSMYGQLDRTPGQIAVGPVKVYAWHGFQTEVTLRFEANAERGIIFFESRTLPERWSEDIPSTVF
ncbi:MAG: hypothetical protein OEY28_01010 [Nitrospira sp.]|nr:hypothetical protein [Nitrospira sp.]